jgi:hypothetical protein
MLGALQTGSRRVGVQMSPERQRQQGIITALNALNLRLALRHAALAIRTASEPVLARPVGVRAALLAHTSRGIRALLVTAANEPSLTLPVGVGAALLAHTSRGIRALLVTTANEPSLTLPVGVGAALLAHTSRGIRALLVTATNQPSFALPVGIGGALRAKALRGARDDGSECEVGLQQAGNQHKRSKGTGLGCHVERSWQRYGGRELTVGALVACLPVAAECLTISY